MSGAIFIVKSKMRRCQEVRIFRKQSAGRAVRAAGDRRRVEDKKLLYSRISIFEATVHYVRDGYLKINSVPCNFDSPSEDDRPRKAG